MFCFLVSYVFGLDSKKLKLIPSASSQDDQSSYPPSISQDDRSSYPPSEPQDDPLSHVSDSKSDRPLAQTIKRKQIVYVSVPTLASLNLKDPIPIPDSSHPASRSKPNDQHSFTGADRCEACRSAGEPSCIISGDAFSVYEDWVTSKDCHSKVTPAGTTCQRCYTHKLGFCRYPIVDRECGLNWKKPTRVELAEYRRKMKGKNKAAPQSTNTPILSSGSGSGSRLISSMPFKPPAKGKVRLIPEPPITPPDPMLSAIVSAIERLNATILLQNDTIQAQNAILGRIEGLLSMGLPRMDRGEDHEDENAEDDDEDKMEGVEEED